MTVLPTEPRELAHEAPCLVTMLRILGRESRHLEDRSSDPGVTLRVILQVNCLYTHCTLRGLDHAMSLVSFRPILRPFTVPSAAPVVTTKDRGRKGRVRH